MASWCMEKCWTSHLGTKQGARRWRTGWWPAGIRHSPDPLSSCHPAGLATLSSLCVLCHVSFVGVHIHTRVYLCVHICLNICGSQRLLLVSSLTACHLIGWGRISQLNAEFASLASLPSQPDVWIPLSLPSEFWDWQASLFSRQLVSTRNLNSGPHSCTQMGPSLFPPLLAFPSIPSDPYHVC